MGKVERTVRRGYRTLVVSGVLVLLIGSLGLIAGHRASASAQAVHTQDRLDLQRTLAGLVGQYTQVTGASLRDAINIDANLRWPAAPSAANGRLADLSRRTTAFTGGFVLVSGFGARLSASTLDLPPATDPGWDAMRASIASGKRELPVSGVLNAAGQPMVAIALPVELDDGNRALVIGLQQARNNALQGYVSNLRYGRTGHGYVVDGRGLVVAGAPASVVGSPLPIPGMWREISRGQQAGRASGLLDTKPNDTRLTTSYATAGSTSWTALTAQDHAEFLGPLQRSGRLAAGALVALLLIAGTALAVLNRKREIALQHAAVRDELTGAYNRRGWFAVAEHELERARRAGEPRALLFVDVDGLKTVNDVLGHREGDAAITATAHLLQQACRASDIVGRLGGDEFVLLLGEGSDAAAAHQRMESVLAEHNATSDAAFELRLSAGAETWSPDAPCSIEELVRRADAVMYVEKARRRGAFGPLLRRLPDPRDADDPAHVVPTDACDDASGSTVRT